MKWDFWLDEEGVQYCLRAWVHIPEVMWSLSKPSLSLSWLGHASLQRFREEKTKLERVYKNPVNQRHALKRWRKLKHNMGFNIVNEILYYFSNSRIFDIHLGETWKHHITSDLWLYFCIRSIFSSLSECNFVSAINSMNVNVCGLKINVCTTQKMQHIV